MKWYERFDTEMKNLRDYLRSRRVWRWDRDDVENHLKSIENEAHSIIPEEIEKMKEVIFNVASGENVPLTRENALWVVCSMTRLPLSKANEYVDQLFDTKGWSPYFENVDGVFKITSATKIEKISLLQFIKNFKSMRDFSDSLRMSLLKFNEICEEMFDQFRNEHPEQFKEE